MSIYPIRDAAAVGPSMNYILQDQCTVYNYSVVWWKEDGGPRDGLRVRVRVRVMGERQAWGTGTVRGRSVSDRADVSGFLL